MPAFSQDNWIFNQFVISPAIQEILGNLIWKVIFNLWTNISRKKIKEHIFFILRFRFLSNYFLKQKFGFKIISFFNFRYVFTNFVQVSLEEEFLDVPKEIIVKILSSEDLRVDTEYQVFLASMAWLDHDVGGRRRYVFDVLVRKSSFF